MRYSVLWLVLLGAAASVHAQVQSRPTEPPLVTAAGEAWFALREPISLAGDVYYPAGAQVFFNGNTMVRSGHFNGVPVYSDTTLEPFSVLFVPVTRGVMQPYERLRAGDLAGTTGSRTPSFPVQIVPGYPGPGGLPMAAVAPTGLPLPVGAIGVFTADAGGAPASTSGIVAAAPSVPGPLVPVRLPENNDGIWIRFNDARWISSGAAVPYVQGNFSRIGEYAGLPVYARMPRDPSVIYVPTRAGLVAPYRAAQPAR